MTKKETPNAVRAAVSAKFNKLFSRNDFNQKSPPKQSEKPDLLCICLICKKKLASSKNLEVRVFRNQKASSAFGVCLACHRNHPNQIQHLGIRLFYTERKNRKRGVK